MLTAPTLEKLHALKLTEMAAAWTAQQQAAGPAGRARLGPGRDAFRLAAHYGTVILQARPFFSLAALNAWIAGSDTVGCRLKKF